MDDSSKTETKVIAERLLDYQLTLNPNVVICDRRVVDEAATALEVKEAELVERLREIDENWRNLPPIEVKSPVAEAVSLIQSQAAELAVAVGEIERLKNLVGDPQGTVDHAEAFLARAERAEAQLAAKDANIKMLGEQMVTERLHGYELLERAERAEAQLAEARKALEPFAEASRRFDETTEHFGVPLTPDHRKPRTEFTHGDLRAARRALTGGWLDRPHK